jgi:hypothetical protein
MFALSSLTRLRSYIGVDNTATNNLVLNQLLLASSRNIQKYLDRELELKSRTEYFDVDAAKLSYFPKATPITVITSIYSDSSGEYSGSEAELDDYYIGSCSDSIVLSYPVQCAEKGLRLIYTGGLAAHGTNSTLVLSSVAGTFTADKYIRGATSGSIGRILATTTATPLTVETLQGVWEAGEAITSQTDLGGADLPGISATIVSITASLVEVAPEITAACEMQCRYDWKHRNDYETAGTNKDSTTFRRNEKTLDYSGLFLLMPEVRSMLNGQRRISL